MIMQVYVIRDLLAESSGPIFEAVNDEVALRQFNKIVKDNDIGDDLELVFVGTFDHEKDEMKVFGKRVLDIDMREPADGLEFANG